MTIFTQKTFGWAPSSSAVWLGQKMLSTIVFYAPFNHRSRDTESLMVAFKKQGHRVILLSQAEGLGIRDFLELHEIETHSFITRNRSRILRHLSHLFNLCRFCWITKVDIVYSHLESANFIASMAQYFIKAKVFICRHHADQYKLLGIDNDFSYKVTNYLAKRVIVFSNKSKRHLIEHEGFVEKSITKINLTYDFSFYPIPDSERIKGISIGMSSEVVLITVGTINFLKRTVESVKVLKCLVDDGIDAKLILLGKGELEGQVQELADNLGLASRVNFIGYVDNVLEYMSASTVLLHPSISESSCVVVKEAGIVKLPVIVCKGIGDFDDYLINRENGFLVNPETFTEEAAALIIKNYQNKEHLKSIGENLKVTVLNNFAIDRVIGQYDSLNQAS